MKLTIRLKLFFIVFSMIIMFLCVSAINNLFFLQKYYYNMNRELFNDMFNQYEKNTPSVTNTTERMERLSGAKVFIADRNYQVKQSNMKPKEGDQQPEPPLYVEIINIIEKNKGLKRPDSPIAAEGMYYDQRTDLEMYVIVYFTKENDYFIIEKPVSTIEDNAKIANNFSLFTGIIIFIFGFILTFILSKKITAPIIEIDKILMRIAKLDFSMRYSGKSHDEIGSLGKNLNIISDELQENIRNLKKTNEQLSFELSRKEKIDAMRKKFLSDASHELKTPISLIRSYAEGLKCNVAETPDEKNSYYDIILDESDKMGTLVSTLLEISELDSGETKIDYEETDLSKLISSIVGKYGPVFVEKELEVNVEIPKNLTIYCDSFKIGQVIENYLCNAIHHAEGDIRAIYIKTEENSEVIRFSIFNTGKNISEEICDKIWNDFYKADKARTRKYRGTGLGLAIVRRIIEMHKGRYGVNNKDNGVEFWFEIDKKNKAE